MYSFLHLSVGGRKLGKLELAASLTLLCVSKGHFFQLATFVINLRGESGKDSVDPEPPPQHHSRYGPSYVIKITGGLLRNIGGGRLYSRTVIMQNNFIAEPNRTLSCDWLLR